VDSIAMQTETTGATPPSMTLLLASLPTSSPGDTARSPRKENTFGTPNLYSITGTTARTVVALEGTKLSPAPLHRANDAPATMKDCRAASPPSRQLWKLGPAGLPLRTPST